MGFGVQTGLQPVTCGELPAVPPVVVLNEKGQTELFCPIKDGKIKHCFHEFTIYLCFLQRKS